MRHTHAIDKSGEDATECELCGFHNGGHMATCPLAEQKITAKAPRDYSPFAFRAEGERDPHGLTERFLKATERRFTGDSITGFGELS